MANVHTKIVQVMRTVQYLQKGKEYSDNRKRYSYVDHNAATEAIRDALVEHGLTMVPINVEVDAEMKETDKRGMFFWARARVTFRITDTDDPTSFIDVVGVGQGLDSSDKSAGMAVTYAKKQALLNAFLVPTGEQDPDGVNKYPDEGDNGQRETPKKPASQPKAKAQSGPTKDEMKAKMAEWSGAKNDSEVTKAVLAYRQALAAPDRPNRGPMSQEEISAFVARMDSDSGSGLFFSQVLEEAGIENPLGDSDVI